MIFYAIQGREEFKIFKQIYVSSESKKILNIASKYKVKIIKRPNYLSQDKVFKIDVIRHAVREIEKKQKKLCSLVVSLQPNSPEVKPFHIDSAIKKLIENNLQEVITVDGNFELKRCNKSNEKKCFISGKFEYIFRLCKNRY